MSNLNEITEFFAWCSLINISILCFTTLFITLFKNFVVNVHAKMFSIDSSQLPKLYFKYLANYKVAILIFNLVPYIALKLML